MKAVRSADGSRKILTMKRSRRDIVLMNAAAALVAGGRARDLKDGVAQAAQSVDGGEARRKLDALVALSRTLAEQK